MNDVQKWERLWGEFCLLADIGANIREMYGITSEFIRIGRRQERIQEEIAELFKKNGGTISC